MTIEYEYKMHRNLWGLIAQGKYQWFRIDENRKDREDFISAIKSFIDTWGCAEFRDTTYSSFRVFYRDNKVKEELERIKSNRTQNKAHRDTISSQTCVDTAKDVSCLTGPKKAPNAYGNFYTKAYEPEILAKQLKRDATAAANARPIPGASVEEDEDEF